MKLAENDDPYNLFQENALLGENSITLSINNRVDCVIPVEIWYSEIKDIGDWKQKDYFPISTLHFSQIVWKKTTSIGCGIARNAKNTWVYVVCKYSPAGNYENEFSNNILPPLKFD